MCGIAGILSTDPADITPERLKTMTDALAHRGPDGEGHWLDPSGLIGLGNRRLSILDLSAAGNQPMSYLDRYIVTHNGEIYNYTELRNTLQSKGYSFSSRTDTEIIPAAYDCFGPDCVRYFEGMFAFALWDRQEKTLFLSRDRFGEKPLFLYHDGTQFLFASEMKALWAAGVPRAINPPMLFNFITIGYTQNPADPGETFYKDITKLPARCFLQYYPLTGKIAIQPYWDPFAATERSSMDPAIADIDAMDPTRPMPHATPKEESAILEEFDSLLSLSVRRRLRSDVPIGISLSGGLDSSAIAGYILRQPNATPFLPAFSAVFPGFAKDETPFIRRVTDHFNLSDYPTTPTADGLIRDLERLAAQQEEPFQSSSVYAQYCVYALAAEHNMKVLMDGQGADELIAGYPKYFTWYWRELYRNDPQTLSTELAAAGSLPIAEQWSWKHRLAARLPIPARRLHRYSRMIRQRTNKDLSKDFVLTFGVSYYELPDITRLNDALYYNALTNGLEELLRYADRNSMAHGVEIRLPFLDHRLAEFLFRLPARFKIRDGWTKWLLRRSTADILPPEIVWRKDKTGYEPPQLQWMTDPILQDYVQEAKRSLVRKDILDPGVLRKKIQPMDAHAAENYDWRYLVIAACLV